MRRLLFVSAVLGLAACKGLLIENGNNYPCDFSQGPGKRDEVCQAGDICGANNLCQKFIYEGPRFEGPATLPSYGPGSGEGALLHPLVLDKRIEQIAGDLPVTPLSRYFVVQDGGVFQQRNGRVGPGLPVLTPMVPAQLGTLVSAQPFRFPIGVRENVLFRGSTGLLGVATIASDGGVASSDLVKLAGTANVVPVDGVRVIELSNPALAQPIAWSDAGVGPVQLRTPGQGWEFAPWTSTSGPLFDVAALSLPLRLWLFALEEEGVEVFDAQDGGLSLAATLDPLSATGGTLKTDQASRIITAVRTGVMPGPLTAPAEVLSTFQVNVTGEGPALSSPWADCRPCAPDEHIELVAPSVRSGFPTVDVVCSGGRSRFPSAVRVFGSVALTQFDACLNEELNPPVPFNRVSMNGSGVVHWDAQWGLLIGGVHGEVWSGESITALEPEFLDRVPLDVAPAVAGSVPSIAAIADDYLAIQQSAENTEETGELLNGFRRVPVGELGVAENSRLLGFVHGVSGWGVDGTGLVVRANLSKGLDAGVPRIETGARLVTAAEELIRGSIGGEAFTQPDGGPIGFFLAADDSLYFVDAPEQYLEPANEGYLLTPVLTPEPSVPIRSLALERTPLGTNGVDRARGYLVTSRDVYSWELNGEPASWSSTPLALTVGEPVEVWFDSTRSALGRVGYRDGQIYSLPGGYPLAEALPESPEGEAPRVLDYENLGGWPVVYATTGLFIAGWDQVDGKLQNRFPNGVNKPMTWRRVTLPDGSEPWERDRPAPGAPRVQLAKPGKLFVAVDPPTTDGQLYRLLLFNDDEVRQVAHHLRK